MTKLVEPTCSPTRAASQIRGPARRMGIVAPTRIEAIEKEGLERNRFSWNSLKTMNFDF